MLLKHCCTASSEFHISRKSLSNCDTMKMFLVLIVRLVICLAVVTGALNEDTTEYTHFGFGVQHMRNRKSPLKLFLGGAVAGCENIEQHYFQDAIIDNFDGSDRLRKWEGDGQRYWLNKELWGGVGYPIFVFIGGEGEEACGRLAKDKSYMYTLARQHRALLVDVEHRFYGESYPTTDMSTENLRYLTSQQALADLARIITFIKKDLHTEESKVITVGGSYPGNLAAWFRLKYPSITLASIASSAPLTAKTNFYEYMEVVGDAMKYFSGQECFDKFEEAANKLAELANKDGGMKKLEKDFQLCSSISNEMDLAVFFSDVMGNVQGTVQYNNERSGVMNVSDICSVMLKPGNAYTNFVTLSEMYRTANNQKCQDSSFGDTLAYLSATAKDHTNNMRPWTFQTCNEFGYFQTADSTKQPFHALSALNIGFAKSLCFGAFNGWTRDPEVEFINELYGDTRIAGTNILFVAGTIDPWHALGVTNTTAKLPQDSEIPVYIEGTAHCNDLKFPSDSDPPSLTAARKIIAERVAFWLSSNK